MFRAAPDAIAMRTPLRESAGVAAFLGWIVPGLGHAWLGRPGKAVFYFVAIGLPFATGLWLSGGLGISFERHPVWLAAQAWLAGPTLAAAWLTKDLQVVQRLDSFDVGQLYLAVSSLLNLVALADVLGIADLFATARRNAEATAVRRAHEAATAAPDAAVGAIPGHPATAAQDEWPPPAALDPQAVVVAVPPPPEPPA